MMTAMDSDELKEIMSTINESQNERILHMLKCGRQLTPMAALKLFGCFRLASRVWELRQRGYDIKSGTKTIDGKRFSIYYM